MLITQNIKNIIKSQLDLYNKTTAPTIKGLDLHILLCFALMVVTVLYKFVLKNNIFYTFYSCFFTCLGSLVFTVCLRINIDKETAYNKTCSKGKIVWEYLVCHLFLFYASFMFYS